VDHLDDQVFAALALTVDQSAFVRHAVERRLASRHS
jgi:hypothetical protein